MQLKPVQYTNDTIYPSSYNTSASSTTNWTLSNQTRFCNPVTNTTYARFTSGTYNAEATVYYNVDCSEIPADATIVSVSASVKANVQNIQYLTPRTCTLCSGTTEKSSDYTMTTSTNAFTLTGNNITRSDLNDLRVKFNVKRTRNNTTSYYFSCYGATFTIVYTVNEEFYRYTMTIHNGSYTCEIDPEVDDIKHDTDITFDNITPAEPNDLKWMKVDGIPVTPTKVGDTYRYTKTDVNNDFSIEIMNSVTPVVNDGGQERTGIAVYKKINGVWVEQLEENYSQVLAVNDESRLIKGWR